MSFDGQTAISIPGYLELNFRTVVKLVRSIQDGGEGTIWLGDVIDAAIAGLHGTTKIAVKILKKDLNEHFFKEITVLHAVMNHLNFTKVFSCIKKSLSDTHWKYMIALTLADVNYPTILSLKP